MNVLSPSTPEPKLTPPPSDLSQYVGRTGPLTAATWKVPELPPTASATAFTSVSVARSSGEHGRGHVDARWVRDVQSALTSAQVTPWKQRPLQVHGTEIRTTRPSPPRPPRWPILFRCGYLSCRRRASATSRAVAQRIPSGQVMGQRVMGQRYVEVARLLLPTSFGSEDDLPRVLQPGQTWLMSSTTYSDVDVVLQ